jgi:predicted DCC family thiol-disulfide oxidoreductase YuxK
MREDQREAPVLLYDGVCGFCNKTVQTILKYDRRGTLRFAPLQSEFAKGVVARHPELANVDSVVFVEKESGTGLERVSVRSTAALRVASYLGGPWRLALVARILPTSLRDYFYDLFARYRYRLFGKYDSCMLPPKEARARFVDA